MRLDLVNTTFRPCKLLRKECVPTVQCLFGGQVVFCVELGIYLFGVQVRSPYFVQLLLIQNALIPQTVCLFIKFTLKVSGQHRLNLAGIVLTVVESEKLQQVHLRGGNAVASIFIVFTYSFALLTNSAGVITRISKS